MHSFADGHLGCFHVLSVIRDRNNWVQTEALQCDFPKIPCFTKSFFFPPIVSMGMTLVLASLDCDKISFRLCTECFLAAKIKNLAGWGIL